MFIGGIFDLKKNEKEIQEVLKSIIKINCHTSIDYKIDKYISSGTGIVHIVPTRLYKEKKFKINTERGFTIVLQGEVDKRTIDSLSESYFNKGDEFIKEIDGHFNIVIFDHKKREIKIFNDRAASCGMYYCQKGKSVTFGTNIKSVLKASEQDLIIDEIAIMQLFHFGHYLEDKTLIKFIKHLDQASIMTMNDEKTTLNKYWTPKFKALKKKKTKYFVNKFNQLIKAAVKKKMEDKKGIGLALSGGLDSRVIAAAAEKEEIRLKTFSYGDPQTNDYKYGKEIAKKLGY